MLRSVIRILLFALLGILAILALSGSLCSLWGQGARKDDIVARGYAGATVTICANDSTTTPCGVPIQLYDDIALTIPKAEGNPFLSDSNGNFHFYVAPGFYKLQIMAAWMTHPLVIPDYVVPGVLPQTFNQGIVTNSNISNNLLHLIRTDDSPWVGGAGILNGYLAPMVRFDLLNSGTQVRSGAQQVLLLYQPNVYGKNYAQLTQDVTLDVNPQTVSVNDASWIQAGDPMWIGIGTTSQEIVTVTAADATHITGVFTKNHANGAIMHVSGFSGYKSTFGIGLDDIAGSTDDLNGANPNVICTAQSPAICNVQENDITNNTGLPAAPYWGYNWTQRYVQGHSIGYYGNQPLGVTTGLSVGSGDGVSTAYTGIAVRSSGGYNGIAIFGVPRPNIGINIAGATTAGIFIGANQPPIEGPFSLNNPLDGIYLSATGTGGGSISNTIAFESYNPSLTKVNWYVAQSSHNLFFMRDTRTPNSEVQPFIDNEDYWNSGAGYRLRGTGSITYAAFRKTGSTSSLLEYQNGGTLGINATSYGASGNAGITRTVVVKGSGGANCNLNFTAGLLTSSDCP